MATPDEVRRRLREVEARLQPVGPPGSTTVPGYGATELPGRPTGPAPANAVGHGWTWVDGNTYQDPFGWLHDWDSTNRTWDAWPTSRMEAVGLLGGGTAGGGGGGGAAQDPALQRLQMDQAQQALEINASEEARAAEMQPYDIAESQSLVQSRRVQEDVAQRDLERQMLSDRFARARDAFDAANLAEQLAVEKKRTATTFLTSIVDNLVPPGMEHPPGLGDQPWPTVARIDWSQLGGGLDPQTDQAVQYLLAMQQQNQGV